MRFDAVVVLPAKELEGEEEEGRKPVSWSRPPSPCKDASADDEGALDLGAGKEWKKKELRYGGDCGVRWRIHLADDDAMEFDSCPYLVTTWPTQRKISRPWLRINFFFFVWGWIGQSEREKEPG